MYFSILIGKDEGLERIDSMEIRYTEYVRPISISSSIFENYIRRGWLYVDKSEYAYRLLTMDDDPIFCFILRPRRFGKSLFVSMLEAALRGRAELFQGLYLGNSDYDFHQYPVIHLDMSDLPFVHGVCNFTAQLNRLIAEQLSAYGIAINEESDPGSNLQNGMKALWQKTGEKIAILIDEYDNPLTSTLSVKEGKEIRECVSELYGYLKPCAEMIHFLFITGITRFSNQSIFSKLNNLRDLTFDPDFSTAFGYTQHELEECFREGIEEAAIANGMSVDALVDELRHWYDGYVFSPDAQHVYNPISINSFFDIKSGRMAFDSYWGKTSVSRTIIELARKTEISFAPGELKKIPLSSVYNFLAEDFTSDHDMLDSSLYAYLFMAGYLTIDHIEWKYVFLRMPDYEVEGILCDVLAYLYLGSEADRFDDRLVGYLSRCDFDSFISEIQDLIRIPSYDMAIGSERYYQSLIYAVLRKVADIDIRSEVHTASGRADLMIFLEDKLFIIELKIRRDAETALKQIIDKRYWDGYSGLDTYLIGMDIDLENDRKLSCKVQHLERDS